MYRLHRTEARVNDFVNVDQVTMSIRDIAEPGEHAQERDNAGSLHLGLGYLALAAGVEWSGPYLHHLSANTCFFVLILCELPKDQSIRAGEYRFLA